MFCHFESSEPEAIVEEGVTMPLQTSFPGDPAPSLCVLRLP